MRNRNDPSNKAFGSLKASPLSIIVDDGVLEWVLVALLALALVATREESSPVDGDTLKLWHSKVHETVPLSCLKKYIKVQNFT